MGIKYFTTEEAAILIGVSARRIRALCQSRRLGTRIGRDWAITQRQIDGFIELPRPPGRPKLKNNERESK